MPDFSYDICEYNDGWYRYILGASDIGELSYAQTQTYDPGPPPLGDLLIYSTYSSPVYIFDAESTRRGDPTATGNFITAMSYQQSGKDRVYAQTTTTYDEFVTAVRISDLDSAITADDKGLMCGVGDNGQLFLYYSSEVGVEDFTEVNIEATINFDECAVTATNDNIVALSARSGDDLYIGYATYP